MSEGWYGVYDWEPFIQIPELDVFSTDPYWIHSQPFSYFETNTREAVKLARKHGKKCQIWVQSVWIAPGREAEVELTWPDVTRLPRHVRLTLTDLDTGRRRYLRTTRRYAYNRFRLRCCCEAFM